MSTEFQLARHVQWIAACIFMLILAGCGGGGSNQGCVTDPSRDPSLPSCASTGTPGPVTASSSITLQMIDAAGNTTNTISPSSPAIIKAQVRDTKGNPAPNIAVTFTTSDTTGRFEPSSGTALTDSNGIARITLLAGTIPGAFTVTASTVGTTSGTVISVTPDGNSIVLTTVTAGSANLGYAVNVPNQPASAAGSIKFIGASPTNIALKGTGGVGRQEFSTLTFQVLDQFGHPVRGTPVNFTLNTTVGGLSLLPATVNTDANGQAVTVVSAGTIPTAVVIVTASVPDTHVTTVSNVLVVSTGLAVNQRTSISSSIGNFEGWDFDAIGPTVTLAMGDHFGNPVPDGSAVSFTAENGIIGASCLTGMVANADNTSVTTPPSQSTNSNVSGASGVCSVTYQSAGVRPSGGRSVVMGFIRGEEDFFDANGNNVCDNCGTVTGPEFTSAFDLSPDIFRDDNENGRWDSGEPCIGPNANGTCSTAPDRVYNGVLANPKIADAQQTTYLGRSYVAIWSGSHAFITATPSAVNCGDFSPPPASGTAATTVHVRIVDLNGNPMPAGTTIVFSGSALLTGAISSYIVPNYVIGIGQLFGTGTGQVPIDEYDVPVTCQAAGGSLEITVTTPRHVVTRLSVPVR